MVFLQMHMMKYQLIKQYQYFLEVNHTNSYIFEDMFRITSKEGIIYLDKPDKLHSVTFGSMAVLHIFAKNDSEEPLLVARINVTVQSMNVAPSTFYSGGYF